VTLQLTGQVSGAGSLARDKPGSPAQRDRRRRILDATIALAGRGGFDAVQMRTVAESADVALGTLYRYFPSKVHLLVAALSTRLEGAQAALDRRPTPGDTPEERVMHVVRGTTRGLQREPHLTEALTRAFMFADASVAPDIAVVGKQLTTMLTKAMKPADDEPPTEDDLAIARVISDVWLAALVAWVTGRASADDVATSLQKAVHLLLR
jgi:TetR/AcrR family transcriptional regulator, cholesterol catabolism regulator